MFWIEDERSEFVEFVEELGYEQYIEHAKLGVPYCEEWSIVRYVMQHHNDKGFAVSLALHIAYAYDISGEPDADELRGLYTLLLKTLISLEDYQGGAMDILKKVQHHVAPMAKKLRMDIPQITLFPTSRDVLDGDFFVTWKYVIFQSQRITIEHPATKRLSKPFPLESSRSAYNQVKRTFLTNLSPIYVHAENGIITELLDIPNIEQCITTLEMKTQQANVVTNKDASPKKVKHLSIQEAKILIKDKNSEFLEHLCNLQLKSKTIAYTHEYRINSANVTNDSYEEAFVFVVSHNKVVYENVLKSRCSVVFDIDANKLDDAILDICCFFASSEINKREKMMEKRIRFASEAIYSYKRVMHTNYDAWEYDLRKAVR